ncbi:MAG: type II CAAX endopeptidase family protein [Buchananella hordeovulneris]|nr:type II CAAX endopeptidase family protein [Buchananella hordeovulneris]
MSQQFAVSPPPARSSALLPAAPAQRAGLPADACPRWLAKGWLTVAGALLRTAAVGLGTGLFSLLAILGLKAVGLWPGLTGAVFEGRGSQILLSQLLLATAALGVYLLVSHYLDVRTRLVELRFAKGLPLAAGLAGGTLALLTSAAIVWALGGYSFSPGTGQALQVVGYMLVVGVGAGVAEEVIFRGALLRSLEDVFGTWTAVLVSGLLFGLVHAGNPNATWWSSLAIGLEAGMLLGLLYVATRSLWLVIAFHAAWNIVQGPILGIPVSGTPVGPSLLLTESHGSLWLTGGSFGIEASVVTVLLLGAVSVALVFEVRRRDQHVAPLWRRRR